MAPAQPTRKRQTRNPEMTRERLLVAATELFSVHGFDGISVDDIVKAARVNKRMVYHYFEDKNGLYAEVLKRVFGRLAEIELRTFADSGDPVKTIQEILRAYFKFLEENPEFVALLAWENLHKGRFIEENPKLLTKAPVLQRLEEVLREGVAQHLFRPGIKVKHLLINLIGVCFVYHANRYTLTQSVGLNLHSPKVLREGLDHAINLTLQGLLLRPAN